MKLLVKLHQEHSSMSLKTTGRDLYVIGYIGVLMRFQMLDIEETSVKLPMVTLTPSATQSRTTVSFTTSGRDLEDRWSLNKLPDIGS